MTSLFWMGSAQANNFDVSDIVIKKLVTHEEVVAQYCWTETGHSVSWENCGAYQNEHRMSVIYFPKAMGDRIVQQLESAYGQNFYKSIHRNDLFHGHALLRGPQLTYTSAEEYISDMEVVVYHSAEYLETWDEIPLEQSDFVPHPAQRSFVGWFDESTTTVKAAIDLLTPEMGIELYGYKTAGTIYSGEINQALNVSLHEYGSHGTHAKKFIDSCDPADKKCVPCEVNDMIAMFATDSGRFVSPDGVRFEIFVECTNRYN